MGLVRAVRLNPAPGAAALPALAAAVASWRHVQDEGLRHDMADLLRAYKGADGGGGAAGGGGPGWQAAMAAVGAPIAAKVAAMIG